MKKNILIFALLLLSLGMSVDVSVAQRWEIYTAELPGKSISFIREGPKGYLWFIIRFRGASRYDGIDFQNFGKSEGLPSDNIYYTMADEAGNFWFATDRGVSRYDGREFHNILADSLVNFILQEGSNIFWFGTDNGAIRYDGENFQTFDDADGLAGNNVSFILEEDGNLWFGTENGVSMMGRNSLLPVYLKVYGKYSRIMPTICGLQQNEVSTEKTLEARR